ncbi:hypothetical protein GWK47_000249 [Chionoecetes opilio]|uniref:Uncharacterized protein n=1 Tax=Chionoecetes opilio TaxID=41210 RepID=A0A8J8WD50_CHIOP|nr:hypothetical protein GWK47_000249 [Chionoecetes opilio]
MEVLNVSRRRDIKCVVEDKNKSLDLRHLTLEEITASGNPRPTPHGKQDNTEKTIALTRYGRCRCHCRRPSCCCCCYLLLLLPPLLLLLLHVRSAPALCCCRLVEQWTSKGLEPLDPPGLNHFPSGVFPPSAPPGEGGGSWWRAGRGVVALLLEIVHRTRHVCVLVWFMHGCVHIEAIAYIFPSSLKKSGVGCCEARL